MTWLVEHFADGRARCLQSIGESPDPVESLRGLVVDEIPESIATHHWEVGRAGCFGCGAGWAAMGPIGVDFKALECPLCGERRSAIAEDRWCYGCGASYTAISEEGSPSPAKCPKCGEMKAVAA